jgi:hypothetical protein
MVAMRRLLVATAIGLNSWAFTSIGSSGKRRKHASRLPRIPTLILVFIMIDISLGLGYMVNELVGRPYPILTLQLDLNRESNLPTWYSSMQWFCVAIFLGLFAHSKFKLQQKRSWLLVVIALLFLALSVDEVARIHEWVGGKTEILLPGGDRANTVFPVTGIWMFVIGIPFLAAFVWLIFSIRIFFQHNRAAFIKLFVGMLITLGGALGFETLTNFVAPGSMYEILTVFSEEVCEIIGGTVVLWGSYELLLGPGFTLASALAVLDTPAQKSSQYSTPKNRKRKRARSNAQPRAA